MPMPRRTAILIGATITVVAMVLLLLVLGHVQDLARNQPAPPTRATGCGEIPDSCRRSPAHLREICFLERTVGFAEARHFKARIYEIAHQFRPRAGIVCEGEERMHLVGFDHVDAAIAFQEFAEIAARAG